MEDLHECRGGFASVMGEPPAVVESFILWKVRNLHASIQFFFSFLPGNPLPCRGNVFLGPCLCGGKNLYVYLFIHPFNYVNQHRESGSTPRLRGSLRTSKILSTPRRHDEDTWNTCMNAHACRHVVHIQLDACWKPNLNRTLWHFLILYMNTRMLNMHANNNTK